MKLIVITAETFSGKEPEAINRLFENGLEILHLRKPSASLDETRMFIGRIDSMFHTRLVLHDHHQLANEFDLKGIHLNQRNPVVDRQLFLYDTHDSSGKFHLSVSRSCHSLEEVIASADCDYVFLSPVFDSISKAGYKGSVTPEQLRMAGDRKIINDRVIALGGITNEKIPQIRTYGFGGVAVLGALWHEFAEDGNVRELLRRFNELKNSCKDK